MAVMICVLVGESRSLRPAGRSRGVNDVAQVAFLDVAAGGSVVG